MHIFNLQLVNYETLHYFFLCLQTPRQYDEADFYLVLKAAGEDTCRRYQTAKHQTYLCLISNLK